MSVNRLRPPNSVRKRGVQRDPGDDAGKRNGQDDQERHRVATKEAVPMHRRCKQAAEHKRDSGGDQTNLDGEHQRAARPGVTDRCLDPLQRQAGDRPLLALGRVEGVQHDEEDGQVDHEQQAARRADQHRAEPARELHATAPRTRRLGAPAAGTPPSPAPEPSRTPPRAAGRPRRRGSRR